MPPISGYGKRVAAWWRELPLHWKRRVAVMSAVALAVAIPATLLIGGSGDETATSGQRIPRSLRLHPSAVHSHGLGISVKAPQTWSASKEHSAIKLRSADRSTELAVSAPAAAGQAKGVLSSVLGAIRDGYGDVSVDHGSARKVGGLQARDAVVSARTRDGTPLDILVAVASGKRHTYLVEVFSARGAPPQRLVQAQLALQTLKLRR